MLHRTRVLLAVIAAIFLVTSYWGCSRVKDDFTENKPPEVHFVNVPLDSSTFNYAPVVRWYGYDPDGVVDAFQYHDDSTNAAVAAYDSDLVHPGTLQAYINALSPSSWVTTYNSADTIYLRRAETDTITQHVFMIRCVDNRGAYSPVKVRTFFRTNNPPNQPTVKWTLDVSLDTPQNYDTLYIVPDTLYWGDTLTSTYGGIGFLWQGSDPDSRALNIIPLTFSYLLVNTDTQDTIPYTVVDDSNHVTGYRKGWSPWRSDAQVAYSATNAFALNPNFQLDGHYEFTLKVRDDGLTEASAPARARFFAYGAAAEVQGRPNQTHNFEKQLLVIDWSAHPATAADSNNFGMRNDQEITDFYNQVIPEGLRLAESVRGTPSFPPELYPTAIADSFDWVLDKNLMGSRQFFYEQLRHYKWIWVVQDNLPNHTDNGAMLIREKVFQDYMKVGGQLMMSGRGLMRSIGIASGAKDLDASLLPDRFLKTYFNLTSVTCKYQYALSHGTYDVADFDGASTTDIRLPQLVVDSLLLQRLKFRSVHLPSLPEIDYFGRSTASTGSDYTVSLYNYQSSSATASYSADSIDCNVDSASTTPSRAYLFPAAGHTRILNVTRVYNVSKQVAGQFLYVDRQQLANGTLGNWRIVVSTPVDHGMWTTSDTLSVDYTYIPIQPSHDQPVASDYIRYQSVVTFNRYTGDFNIDLVTRYRTGICCFPMSFIQNDILPTNPPVTRIAAVIAYEALFFNQSKTFRTNFGIGGGGRPNP